MGTVIDICPADSATEYPAEAATARLAAFLAVQETTGLPQDAIYLNYSEFEHWGAMGSMK